MSLAHSILRIVASSAAVQRAKDSSYALLRTDDKIPGLEISIGINVTNNETTVAIPSPQIVAGPLAWLEKKSPCGTQGRQALGGGWGGEIFLPGVPAHRPGQHDAAAPATFLNYFYCSHNCIHCMLRSLKPNPQPYFRDGSIRFFHVAQIKNPRIFLDKATLDLPAWSHS